MANSRRRVGAEGERVHIATLYFTVKDSASEVGAINAQFENVPGHKNWLAINHQNGLTSTDLPIVAEVTPITITNGALKIRAHGADAGDVNFDEHIDLTDVVELLGSLFRGESLVCPPAADFNGDRLMDIADPIAILGYLFQNERPSSVGEVSCAF